MPCPALPYTSSASPFLPSSHLSSSASPLLWSSRESLKPTVLISSEDLEETHHNHTHRNSEGISEFESVCVDVVLKVDTLLSSSTPNKTLAMGDRGNDLLLLTQEAKDYLKILHALIKEELVAPEFITRADNELLCRRVPSFIDLSLRCLDYGFSSPSSVSVSDSVDTSDPLLRTVDVGLVSISLAILFALVTSLSLSVCQLERKDLCHSLTGVSVQRLLESAVRYLMDPRLNSASGGQQQQEGLSEIQSSLSKGLTALIFKLSSQETVPPGVMMCAIIETLLLCIPEKNHSVCSFSSPLLSCLLLMSLFRSCLLFCAESFVSEVHPSSL
jgi:hypothetical protein